MLGRGCGGDIGTSNKIQCRTHRQTEERRKQEANERNKRNMRGNTYKQH